MVLHVARPYRARKRKNTNSAAMENIGRQRKLCANFLLLPLKLAVHWKARPTSQWFVAQGSRGPSSPALWMVRNETYRDPVAAATKCWQDNSGHIEGRPRTRKLLPNGWTTVLSGLPRREYALGKQNTEANVKHREVHAFFHQLYWTRAGQTCQGGMPARDQHGRHQQRSPSTVPLSQHI